MTLEIDGFIKNFAELFEDTDPKSFKAGMKFRDIEEWSSLAALSVIAMVRRNYKITLTGEDIRKSSTVEDIFNIMKSKQ